MIKVAETNELVVGGRTVQGLVLHDEEGTQVTLPKSEVTGELKPGDTITVFVYTGAEHVYLATTRVPKLKAGEFGFLKVKDVNDQGAFMDWGIAKDLFVPFSEQAKKMVPGKHYLVYLFIDSRNGRALASSKIEKFIERDVLTVNEKEEVEILLCEETDLGIKVIVNNKHAGVLYHNEIFTEIRIGEKRKAYIKRIREDRKIDVSLERSGFGRVDPGTRRILELLKKNNGFLNLHDNSTPEEIKEHLQMSKKTFKKAVGALYKQRLISLDGDGIRLL
ncbi:MAG TPA: S1-like domain-containing RNA-binding protein [Flavobacteriales bacterium]|nr:S1-like domain-containing RNA-binding protein [Flavobacteriales bacterium]